MTDTNSTTDTTITFSPSGSVTGVGDAINYEEMYRSQREENERLGNIIAAGRLAPSQAHPDKDRKPGVTADRLKAMLGPVGFLRASRAEKLTGLGLNPSEISDAGLTKLFGKGNNGKESSDLHKTNPFRYRQLREAAIVLNLYGV
jgi:hypothetical protein